MIWLGCGLAVALWAAWAGWTSWAAQARLLSLEQRESAFWRALAEQRGRARR